LDFMITTVSTRSIALFFSNDGVVHVNNIHHHSHDNGRNKVFVDINPKNIKEFRHIYIAKDDEDNNNNFEKYSVKYTKEWNYIYLHNEKENKYYYVATVLDSVYLCSIIESKDKDPHAEEQERNNSSQRKKPEDNTISNMENVIHGLGITDECQVKDCNKLSQRIIEKALDDLSNEDQKIAGGSKKSNGDQKIAGGTEKSNDDLKIAGGTENPKITKIDKFKNKFIGKISVQKIESPNVLVDILDTGFLNY
ncbi:16270_t:CDS:1, partial [Acaulospora colombiana]